MRRAVVPIEVAAAPNGDTHGREIPIPHQVHPLLMCRIATLRLWLALENESIGVVVPRRWELVDQAGRANPGQLSHTIEKSRIELRPLVIGLVPRSGQRELHRERLLEGVPLVGFDQAD